MVAAIVRSTSAPTLAALRGVVTAASRPKTISVRVSRSELHPIYKKTIERVKHYTVHDERGAAALGDLVSILPAGRRITESKAWVLGRVEVQGELSNLEVEELVRLHLPAKKLKRGRKAKGGR